MKKQTVERLLFLLPILIICVFFIYVFGTNKPPTRPATGATIFAIIFISTLSSLVTKEIGLKGFWAIKKQEKPALFWLEFVLQLILALAILAMGILV